MKIALRYAVIFTGINILFSLLMFVTGLNRSDLAGIFGILVMLIPVFCIMFAVRDHKASIGNGFIGFSDAFKLGLIICVVGGIFFSAYTLIYNAYIDPDFMEYAMNKQLAEMEESGMTEEQIEQSIDMLERIQKPFYAFTLGVLSNLFAGSIISVIMAAVLKKPNPDGIFADSNKLS